MKKGLFVVSLVGIVALSLSACSVGKGTISKKNSGIEKAQETTVSTFVAYSFNPYVVNTKTLTVNKSDTEKLHKI